MDPVLAPLALLFLSTMGVDLGLFNKSSASAEDAVPTDTAIDESGPVADPDAFDASRYGEIVAATDSDDALTADQESSLAWFLEGGDDTLNGSDGDDYAEGGTGNDNMILRAGHDLAYGGEGADRIDAGIGFDTVYGGTGDDTLTGNGGNDILHGDDGDDDLSGGSGADLIYGGAGNDVLSGLSAKLATATGSNTIDGVDGLSGGDGNDHLILGPGDIGEGGAGDDLFEIDLGRTDLIEVARVNDFAAGDQLEVTYLPEYDPQGAEVLPIVSLMQNSDNTGTLILFNDVAIANIIGSQPLIADQITLTRL